MNALTLVFATLCIFALAYRYYGMFLAKIIDHHGEWVLLDAEE